MAEGNQHEKGCRNEFHDNQVYGDPVDKQENPDEG
jgi:hypothetical protein